MSMAYTKVKPPLGIISRWLHEEKRYEEICAAIERYTEARLDISQEWLDEKHELESKIKARLNTPVKDTLYD